ncbi:HNH endonuclease [Roseovarius sp. SK2]|uniref:HNH endonuclease n=1 Tax=Roseovarius TaxID=74030 RepID=UPI00237A9FD4|nr:HNH endonuclease [Roseovarius sp. SK2]MDD9727190.1 HNH endonuclease [Roseovarius sp. SK2]
MLLAVKDTTAARMLDMPASEFRRLVAAGVLPKPCQIGDLERWEYAHIKCIAVGAASFVSDFFDTDEEWTWRDLLDEYERIHGLTDKPSRHIPIAVRAEVFARDGEMCVYCGCEEGPFHLDHVMPLSRGGASDADNLVVACKPCNYDKRARTPEEWREAKKK